MDHNVGGALSVSVRKIATIAVLASVGILAAFLAVPGSAREEETVRGVAEVRHPGVGGLPREPEDPDRPSGRTMMASYYGRTLEGLPLANGQPFDADAYTAAHRSLPFGTELGWLTGASTCGSPSPTAVPTWRGARDRADRPWRGPGSGDETLDVWCAIV